MFKRPIYHQSTRIMRPQKNREELNILDKLFSVITSYSSRPFLSSLHFYKPLFWKIKRLDKVYTSISDTELKQRSQELRLSLIKSGLTHKNITHGFAIIREISGRELGMRHYDCQIMGGLAILHGNMAQMQTGEGKTLTATLPVALTALAKIPSHVISVNDYLTQRDALQMLPVYHYLGLSVGVIIQGLTRQQRQDEYKKDIVYCTNNELVFDYLKDIIILKSKTNTLQRHALRLQDRDNYQITQQLMLRGLHFAVVDEADSVFLDEAITPLIISGDEIKQEQQNNMYKQTMLLIDDLINEIDFTLNYQHQRVNITPSGKRKIIDLTKDLGGLWVGKIRKIELFRLALTAKYIFVLHKHYLVEKDKIVIIDEHTGRRIPDRIWEKGLHQFIEIKEGCSLTFPREVLAKITYQQFFRRYYHLSGMTGTANEVKKELWQVYGLPVVDIPPNMRNVRRLIQKKVFLYQEDKWKAILNSVIQQTTLGRPVLIGTPSLFDSEKIAKLMDSAQLSYQLLNAKQDAHESEIISRAGEASCITIATNMAGRGTDIKLPADVEKKGGLHVIITGLQNSARIDRQLMGRSARQGDRGSYEFLLSIEDSIVDNKMRTKLRFLSKLPILKLFKNRLWQYGLRYCQYRIEQEHILSRKNLLKAGEQDRELLSFTNTRD